MAANPNGKAMLTAAFGLFRQDRRMVVLPIMAAIASLVAIAGVELAGLALFGHREVAIVLTTLVAGVAATSAALIFQVAVCVAAAERIEGRTPTVAGSLAGAWTHRWRILQWAIFGGVVGTLIRALERRFGLVGTMLGFAGAVAWAVATFLIVPVLAFEDVGPIQGVKLSSELLRSRFGTIGRSGLRFGAMFLAWMLPALLVLFVGIAVVHSNLPAGVLLIACGVFGLLVVSLLASTAGLYLRTVLYRYAKGLSVPDLGVDLSRAFVPSGGMAPPRIPGAR